MKDPFKKRSDPYKNESSEYTQTSDKINIIFRNWEECGGSLSDWV